MALMEIKQVDGIETPRLFLTGYSDTRRKEVILKLRVERQKEAHHGGESRQTSFQ